MSTAQLDWDDKMGTRPSPDEFDCPYCGERVNPEWITTGRRGDGDWFQSGQVTGKYVCPECGREIL